MPALPPYIIEPIFEQFQALLPDRVVHHPLGCHKPRIPDRVILEKLVQILVFGCAYRRIAEEGCSATAIRDRRDEWIELGVMEALRQIALSAYDRFIGLELEEVAVDGKGIPIGSISAGANRHDSPLLVPTLEHAAVSVGSLPEEASIHRDRAYDSFLTRERLRERNLIAQISKKGQPAPLQSGQRWVSERTNSWHNAHKKLVWCMERVGRVIDFWVAFSEVVIIVRRLIREGWMRYRWEGRPPRRP